MDLVSIFESFVLCLQNYALPFAFEFFRKICLVDSLSWATVFFTSDLAADAIRVIYRCEVQNRILELLLILFGGTYQVLFSIGNVIAPVAAVFLLVFAKCSFASVCY